MRVVARCGKREAQGEPFDARGLLPFPAVMRAPQTVLACAFLIHDGARILVAFAVALVAPAWTAARSEARALFLVVLTSLATDFDRRNRCGTERLVGTIRRDCLDYLIPLTRGHLLRVLRQYARYYNEARPHSSLGPGFPDPPDGQPVELQPDRHRPPEGSRVVATPILGGLHHEYRLERAA